jgi:CheY-like chemotaxis protein
LRAAERGVTLTRSLLAFARQQPLEPTIIDLPGLMRDMTNLLRHTIPASIDIEFVSAAGLWKCEADAGQLQNALLNLAVNSRDAMPEGGKLTIETGNVRLDEEYAATHEEITAGQYVMIAVSDTGAGMSPETAARAFEPFYTTKRLGHGTGLGLSMVYGFAKQSGGHVAIYSEPGHGTTVRIYLPRWIGQADKAVQPKTAAFPTANNERILVVEDDEDVRFIAVTMLRSLGYRVLEATDGNGALALLRQTQDIALLVTDVMLSGAMNGKRVALEAGALRPGIKILYMSGYSENAIVHHGRLDQGVHFIQKPFRKQDMAQKVRQVLSDNDPAN